MDAIKAVELCDSSGESWWLGSHSVSIEDSFT